MAIRKSTEPAPTPARGPSLEALHAFLSHAPGAAAGRPDFDPVERSTPTPPKREPGPWPNTSVPATRPDIETDGAVFNVLEALQFNDVLARTATLNRPPHWVFTACLFDCHPGGFLMFDTIRWTDSAPPDVLSSICDESTAYLTLATYRPKQPKITPFDLLTLGQLVGGAWPREIQGAHQVPCLLDWIIVDGDGAWRSVFDLNGVGARSMCPACHLRAYEHWDVPAAGDDRAWDELREHHRPGCEWLRTRGGRVAA